MRRVTGAETSFQLERDGGGCTERVRESGKETEYKEGYQKEQRSQEYKGVESVRCKDRLSYADE